ESVAAQQTNSLVLRLARRFVFRHRSFPRKPLLPVYAEQLRHTPDEVLLELMALAVGEDDLPEILDDADALFLRRPALEHRGKTVEIDRFALGRHGVFHQGFDVPVREAVIAGKNGPEPVAFAVADRSV